MATRPDRRGQGIASALLAELERRLLVLGCAKVNLLIEPDNAGISCNVIAPLAHDHLFVEWDQGARALALLREL
jgi:GNAT superfamily N-acetyltransferase